MCSHFVQFCHGKKWLTNVHPSTSESHVEDMKGASFIRKYTSEVADQLTLYWVDAGDLAIIQIMLK